MDQDQAFSIIKEMIVDHLGVGEGQVNLQATFVDDLGADSLDIVELIMALEEKFGMEISDDDAQKISTVNDAVQYIVNHQK